MGGRRNRTLIRSLSPNSKKVFTLFTMIIKGLLWQHWQSPLPSAYVVRVFSFTNIGVDWFRQCVLSLSREQYEDIELAEGAFRYQCTRSPEDPFLSAWIIDMYGTLTMCDSPADGQLPRTHVAALTGPAGAINALAESIEEKAL